MNELVSIIVRAYNAEKYIKEALNSILHNTYRGPIEIIICYDSGSKDRTLETIENIMNNVRQTNRTIKLIKHDHLSPFYSLLNFGFTNVSGNYISILDYDNLYPSMHIEGMVDKALKSDKTFLFVRDIFFEDTNFKVIGSSRIPKDPCNVLKLIQGNYIDGNGMFIHKRCLSFILDKLKKLQHRLYEWIFEDWLIALIALKHCSSLYVNESYVFYRVHEKNLTGLEVRDPRTNIFSNIRNISTLLAFYELEKESLTRAELKAIEKSLLKNILMTPKFVGDYFDKLSFFSSYSTILKLFKNF